MGEIDPGSGALPYFGSELRRRRLAAGLSQTALGQACFVSGSLIGMLETARRTPSYDLMTRADEALGADAFTPLWPLVSREGHPSYFRPYIEYENNATLLRQFEPLAVPGLLQAEDYARALLSRPDAPPELVEELVTSRLERQKILDRAEPPMLVVLLDGRVLSRTVGSRAVMSAQLGALLEATRRPMAVIQVIPASSGAGAGLAGSFVVATPAEDGGDIVYFETTATGQVIERADDVATCVASFETLRAETWNREQSRELIRKRKEEFEL